MCVHPQPTCALQSNAAQRICSRRFPGLRSIANPHPCGQPQIKPFTVLARTALEVASLFLTFHRHRHYPIPPPSSPLWTHTYSDSHVAYPNAAIRRCGGARSKSSISSAASGTKETDTSHSLMVALTRSRRVRTCCWATGRLTTSGRTYDVRSCHIPGTSTFMSHPLTSVYTRVPDAHLITLDLHHSIHLRHEIPTNKVSTRILNIQTPRSELLLRRPWQSSTLRPSWW